MRAELTESSGVLFLYINVSDLFLAFVTPLTRGTQSGERRGRKVASVGARRPVAPLPDSAADLLRSVGHLHPSRMMSEISMPNQSHYSGNARSTSRSRIADNPAYHAALVIKHAIPEEVRPRHRIAADTHFPKFLQAIRDFQIDENVAALLFLKGKCFVRKMTGAALSYGADEKIGHSPSGCRPPEVISKALS
jgi:hypothetical protein